jgi:ribonuclease J
LSHPKTLQLIPLGGLGEFGMNAMLYRWGDDAILVDAGQMFPGDEQPGVDAVVPDFSFLHDCGRLHGLLLTHGHEDHIGAVPFLLERHDPPVHGGRFTLGLLRRRLAERAPELRPKLVPFTDAPIRLGPFTVEPLAVPHSIPGASMLVVRTPVGTLLHTADFKLDPDPVDGVTLDRDRLETLGREGLLGLLADSTNADRPGSTAGERSVAPALDALVSDAGGRVVVTTFASHIHRVRLLGEIAARHGRRLALLGASLTQQADVAEELGMLTMPRGTRVDAERISELPAEQLLVVASGSQGEPNSAMARVAMGRHRQLRLEQGDLVIHSAREIPGCGKNIGRMVNDLLRSGVRVVHADEADVHVSGHAAADDLRELIETVKPRFHIPIHGEYRQLQAHAALARDCGLPEERVLVAESGDVIALDAETAQIVGSVEAGKLFVDDRRQLLAPELLRERRQIAGDGIVVPVLAMPRDRRPGKERLRILARGFLPAAHGTGKLLEDAHEVVAESLAEASREERGDDALLEARIGGELKRFLRRRTNRRPLVIPVILEL